MEGVHTLSAVEIARLVRAGQLSPVEVVEAVRDRASRIEPRLDAFCEPTFDRALDAAHRLADAVVRGEELGPLAGVPISIKDLIFTRGVRTAGGSYKYRDFVPEESDVAVDRIEAAGGLVIGKTTVPEFGYSGTSVNAVSRPTRNPWNLDMTPGGSSSGSAAAVAAGIGPVTLGSDGGGSVRVPASFCGVFGIKPSMGRVPLYPGCRDPRFPGFSSWEPLEQLGPLSRTVADSALLLSVVTGPDRRDVRSIPCDDIDWMGSVRSEGPLGLRVAYSEDLGYAAVEPEVRALVGRAVEVFADDLGCVVDRVDPGWDDPLEAFWGMVASSTDLVGMRALADELGDHMSPHLRDLLAQEWTAEQLSNAEMTRKSVAWHMSELMGRYDLLLTPSSGITAFELGPQFPPTVAGRPGRPLDAITFASPMNMTGQPAASVPIGFTEAGLPVGLQIVGPHLGDGVVLRASAAVERVRPWADRWPAL